MATSKVSTKGQVTIPQHVRERMGLRPGDRVRFTVRSDGTVLVERVTRELISLRGILRGKSRRRTAPSIEEINRAIERGGSVR